MGYFIFTIILIPVFGIPFFYIAKRNKTLINFLEEEKNKRLMLEETLVEVLDDDGNIRGQLALPGARLDSEVQQKITNANEELNSLRSTIELSTKKLKEANEELSLSKEREKKLEKVMAEIVDKNGAVLAQIRLPGKQIPPPNKTPCGKLCRFAKWSEDVNGKIDRQFRCHADQGKPVNYSRPLFLDANNQCTMFEREA